MAVNFSKSYGIPSRYDFNESKSMSIILHS